MNLIVRDADESEFEYAWSLYRPFISHEIFPKISQSLKSDIETWAEEEEGKFKNLLKPTSLYIIEVDGAKVGWVSLLKSNNKITVQNVFIEEEWKGRGLGQRLFHEMIPVWKAERRLVEVPVLLGAEFSEQIIAALEEVGFISREEDGLVRSMVANWSH